MTSATQPGAGAKLSTVDDALRILELLGERGELSVANVATELRCSRSSAYRVVRTLQGRGWVSEARFSTYELGPRAAMLGAQAVTRAPVRDISLPIMRRLVDDLQETVTLSLLLGDQRICIEQLESPREIRMTVTLGHPYPLYAGASGKAILMGLDAEARAQYYRGVRFRRLTSKTVVDAQELESSLSDCAKRGYVASVAERDPEAFSVAAPIHDRSGVTGAIAICGPASRFETSDGERYGLAVREAAHQISAMLGATASDVAAEGAPR